MSTKNDPLWTLKLGAGREAGQEGLFERSPNFVSQDYLAGLPWASHKREANVVLLYFIPKEVRRGCVLRKS